MWLPLVPVIFADFSLREWRYSKPVTFPTPQGGEELVEVTLDRDLFEGAAPGQVDLRLVEGGGREVAYQLVVEQGLARKVLFMAQPGETYSVYYGNPNAGPVSYDLAKLLPYLDSEAKLTGDLGAQVDNPEFAVPQPPFSERFPWLIPVGVGAAAAVMVVLLFGFFKQVKKSLPPPGARDDLE